MTPTPHGQVPEALIDLIDAYAETRHRCGGIYNARTEAARKAVIEALSGVQAQSAPAAAAGPSLRHLHDLLYTAQRTTGDAQAQAIAEARIALSGIMTAQEPAVLASRAWPKVSGVSRDEGHSRALLVFFAAEPTDDEVRAVHDTLAASPTSPAEQQAPRCSYCDGTGDVHGIDGEWRGICTECDAGTALRQQAAPKAAPGEQFDSEGFRAWVRKNLPDDTMIGNSEWWANHLTEWAQRFAKAAPQQEAQPTEIPQVIERMATDRYKVVPSHESMFHRWAVVAGSGTQQLYLGREVECQNMARKFAGAFLDGAFFAMQQPAPQQEAPKAAPLQQEWRLVLPGGKHTGEWESARVGDYNRGWNDYRKAAIAALNSVVWPARASGNWVAASTWLRNNYQDYPNITSLCDAMLETAPQQEAQKPAFVDVSLRTAIAKAVYQQVRVEFEYRLCAWTALDADEQQRIVDSIRGLYTAPQPAPAIGDELRDTLVAVSAAIAELDDRAAQKMISEILAASTTPPAEQQAQPGAVYAELPAPLLIQYDEIDCEEFGCFAEEQMRDFADRTHALRMQAAPKAAPAVDIATAGELQAFEAWYKQDCAVAGAAAKMAAKSAWHARAALAASPTPPAEQQARYSRLHDADALHGKQLSVYGTATTTGAALGGVYAELPRAGAIGYASVVDVDSYVTRMTIGPRLPGVRDIALWTTDQLRDFADRTHALRMEQAASKAAPVKACVCGEPQAPGTVHRVDGPCYVAAPQQAAPKAAPVESDYSKWDAELGRTAMRFVDRAGDVHPGIDDAETICAEFHKAMSEVIERMPHVQRMAAPQQEAQEPGEIPESIERMATGRYKVVPSHESMFHRWAVVAGSGTQQLYLGSEVECQNMARKFAGAFLDGAFVTMQSTSPNPAPAPLSDDVVKDAARWRMAALIGNEVMLHPDKRTHATAVKAYMDATHSGSDLTGAVDAAIAAQGGKDAG
jgi:hypothetical protein